MASLCLGAEALNIHPKPPSSGGKEEFTFPKSKLFVPCVLFSFPFSLQEWQPPGRVIPIPLGLFHVKIPKLSEVPGLHLQDWFSVFCTDQGRRKTSAAVRSEGASLARDIPQGTGAESIDVLRHAARRRWRWEWEQRQWLPALGFLP